ncbi:MAG TPA: acetyl-CoA carboxylase biotin carboxyl carrier protein [Steroidobacteraceae bacterium]|nr:acetyl-CoA carboxylase biotin carboxyl carrier protein [Steroidobacteraceae bacterium]
MSLTARDVAEILRVLEESSFDTLDLDMDGVQLRLRRSGAPPAREPAPLAAASRATADAPAARTAATAPAHHAAPVAAAPEPGAVAVPAPLLGVYYRAPKPGEPPFVEAGDRVQADTIIGIIEVMKLMNTVRAGVAGQIVAISARNGELVEYGEAILWVRPD